MYYVVHYSANNYLKISKEILRDICYFYRTLQKYLQPYLFLNIPMYVITSFDLILAFPFLLYEKKEMIVVLNCCFGAYFRLNTFRKRVIINGDGGDMFGQMKI